MRAPMTEIAVPEEQVGQDAETVSGAVLDGLDEQGTQAFDPLGNLLSAGGNATALSIGYQSGYTDNATSQVNMAARWYSPSTGQFNSADTVETSPVPDTAGGNPYGYANASPLDGTDPTGHNTVDVNPADACESGIAWACVVGIILNSQNNSVSSGDTCPTAPDGSSCDYNWMCYESGYYKCSNGDDWWNYDNPYDPDPCQGLSGPACAQRNPTLAPPPGSGPGLYLPSCDAACEAAKWLAHIKELSKLGRTTIDFAVGAAADAGAAANSIASSVISTAVGLGIGLATVLTDGPGGSTDTRGKEDDPCDQGPTITAIGIYLPMQSVHGHP